MGNGKRDTDHWHALNAIHAYQAGKEVYLQKPLAFTVREGFEITKAVRSNKRVLQVGSQQRSAKEFQQAIELIRSGAIGHIETIYARVGEPPKPYDLPEQPVPENLNWNLWMGPLNDPEIHYHPALCPPISLDPEVNERLWGPGAGIVKPVTDLLLTGERTCLILPRQLSVWMVRDL